MHIYRLSDLSELAALQPPCKLGVSAVGFSGDGERLAVSGVEPDTLVCVYNWRTVSSPATHTWHVRGETRAPAALSVP